jgi:hypothetical protein
MSTASPTHRRLELAAAVLLAIAAVATAWSAYQARVWTGEQASNTSKATATRISANRVAALANRQVQVDVATFTQWLDARTVGRSELAAFYRTRFRPEFKTAFAAWIATSPFTNSSAPSSPFEMPQYRLRTEARANRMEVDAAADTDQAKDANQHANNYMLAVVLLATSLFFAGLSTKLEGVTAQRVILGLGWAVFLGALIWLATLPVELTT